MRASAKSCTKKGSRKKKLRRILCRALRKINGNRFFDGMCVRKNTSQPANVRAFGACAAAGFIPLKKMAEPSF